MSSRRARHKHVRLNQAKLNRVKSTLDSPTEIESLRRAIDFVLTEAEILKALRRVKGKGKIKRLFGP